tara:strand:- start:2108 stop:3394 length:1287 start_codon:yes stop_codon:yes gene_type:complete
MAQLDCSQGLALLNLPLVGFSDDEGSSVRAYEQGFVVNTGVNATSIVQTSVLETYGIPLLSNTRLFVVSNGRIASSGYVYEEGDNAIAATIWGTDPFIDSINGLESGAELEFYVISGTQIFILSNPSQPTGAGNESVSSTFEVDKIFGFEDSLASASYYCDIQLSDFGGASTAINSLNDYIDYLSTENSQLESEIFQQNIQLQQSANLQNQNQNLLAEIAAQDDRIFELTQEVFDISAEYGNYIFAQQDAVANAYAEGAASVNPEDGIGQSNVDAAYAEGVASVDITSDNQAVYEAAFLEGADSQQDAIAEAFEAGVASVDITSDNEPLESIITLQDEEIQNLEGIVEGLQTGISTLQAEIARLTQLSEEGQLTGDELLAAESEIVQLQTILDAYQAEGVTLKKESEKNKTLLYAAVGGALLFTLIKK